MCDCEIPKPIASQLYQDSYYLRTNKNLAKAPIGKVVLILHDTSAFGKIKASARWYRRWVRSSSDPTHLIQWIFDGMQKGNFKEDSLFKEI